MYTPIVIVPYRNRQENLKEFIPAIKKYLPNCEVYVVEQLGNELFNKGSLINSAVLTIQSYLRNHTSYFMFHDVDLLPVDVDYSYPVNPTHVATELGQYDYKMPYPDYFGGCVLFTFEQFKAVNGFSNKLKGWGCEDDLFYDSFIKKGITVDRRKGRMDSMHHDRFSNNDAFARNVELWKKGRDFTDGMDSCKFVLSNVKIEDGYTLMQVTLID